NQHEVWFIDRLGLDSQELSEFFLVMNLVYTPASSVIPIVNIISTTDSYLL
ncbi:hypothetical protein F442_11898, partial [Phytophthora nicotianae P10297]